MTIKLFGPLIQGYRSYKIKQLVTNFTDKYRLQAFTIIMNSRIMDTSSKLSIHYRSDLMPNKFIRDHGFSCWLTMEDASKSKSMSESLGVILDQAKACNCIHPKYLRKVLKRFSFPCIFIKCIRNLFFSNLISVNVNGS